MPWRALVATKVGDRVDLAVEDLEEADLPPGEVVVDVEWSSINYKDAMAAQPNNRVARISPLVPGVDLAGVVAASSDGAVGVGTPVIVHGHDVGVARHGGFATRARVPTGWVVPLPAGLTTRRAAAVGTAGFTAVLSVDKLRCAGVAPGDGPVLVTGASGGVGSMAVAALGALGYEVVASTGKEDEHAYLRDLGASEVIGRDVAGAAPDRVLGPERWAGAVDAVGGSTLADVLRSLRYGGSVAASGLVAGAALGTTVYPFIVRAVSLLGVDSVRTPIEERRRIWETVPDVLPAAVVDAVVAREVALDEVPAAMAEVLGGRVRGRVLVRP